MTDNQERSQRKGSRTGPRRGQRENRRERAPADRNAVPSLRHGTENNFATFKKKVTVACLETYKDLARMFDLGAYYVPPEIQVEDYDLDDDPHGVNISEYKDARKARTRHMNTMKAERAGLYAYLLLHLSNESMDAAKLSDGWDLADADKDPLMLWLIIEVTHRVATASRIPAVQKGESRRSYQACAQSTYESIVKFKERFDDLRESYVEHGNPEMDEEDVAMDFYRALDNSRYAAFKTNLVNGMNSGAIKQPATLNEMYSQASSYLIPTKPGHAGTSRTAFATTADTPIRGKKGGKGSGRGRDPKARGSHAGRGHPPRAEEKEREPVNVHEDRDCWGCGARGHILRNCPAVETTEEGVGDPAGGSAHMTTLSVDDGDDSDDDSVSTRGSMPTLNEDSSSDEDSDDEWDGEEDSQDSLPTLN